MQGRGALPLPVPTGISVGHPAITAGTIGARVTNGTNVFVLSNNHVFANVNQAAINDPILQPGSYDGGVSPGDVIAHLADFEPIKFCTVFCFWLICDQTNTIDAAIAQSTANQLGAATPGGQFGSGVGYGSPSRILHPAYGNPVHSPRHRQAKNQCDQGAQATLGQSVMAISRFSLTDCRQKTLYIGANILGRGPRSTKQEYLPWASERDWVPLLEASGSFLVSLFHTLHGLIQLRFHFFPGFAGG